MFYLMVHIKAVAGYRKRADSKLQPAVCGLRFHNRDLSKPAKLATEILWPILCRVQNSPC